MEEKELIRGELDSKKRSIILIISIIIESIIPIVGSIICMFFKLYIISLILLILTIIIILIVMSYFRIIFRNSIIVTNKRVCGITRKGVQVDIPIDKISAVKTTNKFWSHIIITSSSGIIKFSLIKNNNEIREVLNNMIINREEAKHSKENTQLNYADELKKLKDLLDQGIITQEEFDQKKKQILGI